MRWEQHVSGSTQPRARRSTFRAFIPPFASFLPQVVLYHNMTAHTQHMMRRLRDQVSGSAIALLRLEVVLRCSDNAGKMVTVKKALLLLK